MYLKSEFIEFFKENALEKVVNAINNCLQLTSEIEGSNIHKGVVEFAKSKGIKNFNYVITFD